MLKRDFLKEFRERVKQIDSQLHQPLKQLDKVAKVVLYNVVRVDSKGSKVTGIGLTLDESETFARHARQKLCRHIEKDAFGEPLFEFTPEILVIKQER
jgi:hypothetical protein